MPSPEIALIAAVARNGAIGLGNDLIFREPADQKHFRDTTLGHPVVMGRKTWESLPARFRPLPGRRNIVVSRNRDFVAAGAEVAHDLNQALALAQAQEQAQNAPRLFVIGGAELYRLALPQAQWLMLTEVDADLQGDTFFPAWDRSRFDEIDSHAAVSAAGLPFRFVTYHRRAQP